MTSKRAESSFSLWVGGNLMFPDPLLARILPPEPKFPKARRPLPDRTSHKQITYSCEQPYPPQWGGFFIKAPPTFGEVQICEWAYDEAFPVP